MDDNQFKARQIKQLFEFQRGVLLDYCEQELGDGPKWRFFRGRLLKFLSPDRGLEGKVLEIVLAGDEDVEVVHEQD